MLSELEFALMRCSNKSTIGGHSSLLIHDYGGYGFPAQLALELAARGFDVHHCYCGSNPSTPIGLELPKSVPSRFRSSTIDLPRNISKTSFVRRAIQERQYGQRLASLIRSERPQVVVLANTPIDTLSAASDAANRVGANLVIWVQDLLSEAALRILPRKLGTIGKFVGRWYQKREAQLFSTADHLIPITNDFAAFFESADIPAWRWTVIENWANASANSPRPKVNSWADEHALTNKFVFLYSGSLGYKYNPAILLDLAAALQPHENAVVVVNSDGPGVEWLTHEGASRGLQNKLLVNGFQPVDRLSDVYGTADVLVGLLDDDAASYCVPSKVLGYLCAGKPLLLSIPQDNLAARIVSNSKSGLVSATDHSESFVQNGLRLLHDPDLRTQMGRNARKYAEKNFDIQSITDKFVAIFSSL